MNAEPLRVGTVTAATFFAGGRLADMLTGIEDQALAQLAAAPASTPLPPLAPALVPVVDWTTPSSAALTTPWRDQWQVHAGSRAATLIHPWTGAAVSRTWPMTGEPRLLWLRTVHHYVGGFAFRGSATADTLTFTMPVTHLEVLDAGQVDDVAARFRAAMTTQLAWVVAQVDKWTSDAGARLTAAAARRDADLAALAALIT